MSSICLKIRAIKTKAHINQAFIHNNPEQAKRLFGELEHNPKGKRFSQCVTQTIKEMRANKDLDRRRSANEIEVAEIVFSASPEWFRDKTKFPPNWRNLDDKAKNDLFKQHKPLPEKIEQFQKMAMRLLKNELGEKALLNVTLHTHETSPHVHALVLPIAQPDPDPWLDPDAIKREDPSRTDEDVETILQMRYEDAYETEGMFEQCKPDPPRLSYEKLFGQAKGKKPRDGFEVWQDKAGVYFGNIGLSRGMRGSTSEYKPPKEWNKQTEEAKAKAEDSTKQLQKLIREKALIDKYGNRLFAVGNAEENKKIGMAKQLLKAGKTSEGLEKQILEMHRKTATQMHTERNANEHLRYEKAKATKKNADKKTSNDFVRMYQQAKKKDPDKAEKALETLKALSTPAAPVQKLDVSPGPDLKAHTLQIRTTLDPTPQPTQENATQSDLSPPASTGDDIGEAEPQPSKPLDKMTAGEKMTYFKALKAWQERENARRERLAKMRPKF